MIDDAYSSGKCSVSQSLRDSDTAQQLSYGHWLVACYNTPANKTAAGEAGLWLVARSTSDRLACPADGDFQVIRPRGSSITLSCQLNASLPVPPAAPPSSRLRRLAAVNSDLSELTTSARVLETSKLIWVCGCVVPAGLFFLLALAPVCVGCFARFLRPKGRFDELSGGVQLLRAPSPSILELATPPPLASVSSKAGAAACGAPLLVVCVSRLSRLLERSTVHEVSRHDGSAPP